MQHLRTRYPLVAGVVVGLSLAGCGIPRQDAGAMARVREGEVRVGVVESPPWVTFGAHAVPRGIDVDVVLAWAESVGATVVWRRGDLPDLAEAVRRGGIDVLAAGLEADTPHRGTIVVTRPWLETDDRSDRRSRVLGVTPGESALLYSLDRFLAMRRRDRRRARAVSGRR